MKTYKQQNKELWNTIRNLKDELVKNTSLKNIYLQALENHNLFNPVKYQELEKKFNLCVDALEAINSIERNNRTKETKGVVEIIAEECLYQVGKK